MTISLDQIKKLRSETKAGIMDCRMALEESKGDFTKAKAWLLEKGKLKAAKKASRVTKAGIVEAYIHHGSQIGSLIKLTCETDFVAKTKEFKDLAHEICLQVAAMKPKNISELLKQEYIRDNTKTMDVLIKETIAKVGENIKIEEIAQISF